MNSPYPSSPDTEIYLGRLVAGHVEVRYVLVNDRGPGLEAGRRVGDDLVFGHGYVRVHGFRGRAVDRGLGDDWSRTAAPVLECESCWDAAKVVARQGIPYFIVGMTNSAPSLMPDGQREVTVLTLV